MKTIQVKLQGVTIGKSPTKPQARELRKEPSGELKTLNGWVHHWRETDEEFRDIWEAAMWILGFDDDAEELLGKPDKFATMMFLSALDFPETLPEELAKRGFLLSCEEANKKRGWLTLLFTERVQRWIES